MGSDLWYRVGEDEVGEEEQGVVDLLPSSHISTSDSSPCCCVETTAQGCAETPLLPLLLLDPPIAVDCPSGQLASYSMTQILASFKLVTTFAAASAPTPPSVQLGSSRASSSSGLISSSSSDKARYSASAQVDRIYFVVSM